MNAAWQIITTGTEQQKRDAIDVLVDTRRRLYGLLAEGGPVTAAYGPGGPGGPRGSRGKQDQWVRMGHAGWAGWQAWQQQSRTGVPPAPADQLRMSDADRDQAAASLGEHYAQGRITTEEHSERLDRIWSARTRAELAPLFADLPAPGPLAPAPAPVPPPRRGWGPPAVRAWRGPGLFPLLLLALVIGVFTPLHVFPLMLIGGLAWVVLRRGGCRRTSSHMRHSGRQVPRVYPWNSPDPHNLLYADASSGPTVTDLSRSAVPSAAPSASSSSYQSKHHGDSSASGAPPTAPGTSASTRAATSAGRSVSR